MVMTHEAAAPMLRHSEPLPDGPLRNISQVAETLSIPQHVLRFWETRFPQIAPVKSRGGRRYYRPEDVATLRSIKEMLYDKGYTIRGVQNVFKEQQQQARAAAPRHTLTPLRNHPLPLFEMPSRPEIRLSQEEKAVVRQIVLELTALQHLLVSRAQPE